MKRRLAAVLAAAALVVGAPTVAEAYRTNNSSWTDYNYVAWSGLSGGYVTATSNNKLRATSWTQYCNFMTWSGSTKVYAPNANETYLNDYWSVSGPGSFSASLPAGVSVGGGGSNATWATNVGGSSQSHNYGTYPINFKTSLWFYSINHSVTSSRRVGTAWYNGPSFQRYEWVC